jgi:hypothetical protein
MWNERRKWRFFTITNCNSYLKAGYWTVYSKVPITRIECTWRNINNSRTWPTQNQKTKLNHKMNEESGWVRECEKQQHTRIVKCTGIVECWKRIEFDIDISWNPL